MTLHHTVLDVLRSTPLGARVPIVTANTYRFEVSAEELPRLVTLLKHELRFALKTVVTTDERTRDGMYHVHHVFGLPKEHGFVVLVIQIDGKDPKLDTLVFVDHEFSLYEKENFSFFGIEPVGNPRPESVILHHENFPRDVHPLRKDVLWKARLARKEPEWKDATQFRVYRGDGVYEVPVGPVHAGIIEPGHFRFSLLGEEILSLQARLGYVHKGVEKLFENISPDKRVHLAERISGDSSVSHALSYVQAVESLSGMSIPLRARLLRVVYAELERLANHFNDIGFIMSDTGFSFGGAHGVRLREVVLQTAERLTKSRFMRSVIVEGGVTVDIPRVAGAELSAEIERIEKDFNEVMDASLRVDSLLNRLENTGVLDSEAARAHGVVGVAARAIGIHVDARVDFPYAAYDELGLSVITETAGDVNARFKVRVREVAESCALIRHALKRLESEKSAISVRMPTVLPKDAMGVGVVEGWRGDIVYVVITDADGHITRVKVRDPSFLNWRIYPYTTPADIVADFPLINKSYNLSYSGNDL